MNVWMLRGSLVLFGVFFGGEDVGHCEARFGGWGFGEEAVGDFGVYFAGLAHDVGFEFVQEASGAGGGEGALGGGEVGDGLRGGLEFVGGLCAEFGELVGGAEV